MTFKIKIWVITADSGIKKAKLEFAVAYSLREARQKKRDLQGFDLSNVEIKEGKLIF